MSTDRNTDVSESNQHAINELTNERYRVLEAKVNKMDGKIDTVDEKADDRHDLVIRELYDMKTEMRTSIAFSQQSTKNTIIGSAATIIGGMITLGILLAMMVL